MNERTSFVPSSGRTSSSSSCSNHEVAYGAITDTTPICDRVECKVYPRRWYILTLYTCLTFINALAWNTFGPISDSVEHALDLTDGDISLSENWNNFTYIAFLIPLVWLMEVYSLRASMIITALSLALGCVVRAPLYNSDWYKIQLNVGQFLIGISGPVCLFGCTSLSSVWFPAHQRVLATSIMSMAQAAGLGVSFIIGPLWVDHFASIRNSTTNGNSTMDFQLGAALDPADKYTKSATKYGVVTLLYLELAIAVTVCICVLIYFPSKPPKPPSASSVAERLPVLASIKLLLTNVQLWFLTAIYAISQGIFSGWISVLSIALKDGHIVETQAGWIGFIMTLAGIVFGIGTGLFTDAFPKTAKFTVILMMSLSLACYFVLSCLVSDFLIPTNSVAIWITSIASGMVLTASSPVLFETACEEAYPVPESVVTGWLTWLNNIASALVLLPLMDESLGSQWLNWAMVGAIAPCLPLAIIMRPTTRRLNQDDGGDPVTGGAINESCSLLSATTPGPQSVVT